MISRSSGKKIENFEDRFSNERKDCGDLVYDVYVESFDDVLRIAKHFRTSVVTTYLEDRVELELYDGYRE